MTPLDEGVPACVAGLDLPALAAGASEAVRESRLEVGSAHGPVLLPLDPLPRVVDGAEWDRVAAGLVQRLRAIEAFLRDPSVAVEAGVLAEDVLRTCVYAEDGPAPPAVPVGLYGPDLVRTTDGELVVLEDNLRTPTLMAYAAAAREIVSALVPGRPRPCYDRFPALLAGVLRAAAPDVDEPVVAVLGDVAGSNVRWEPARIAADLGVPLVDLDDLRVRDDRLLLPDGRPVDVLWRRTSEERLRDDTGRLDRLGEALLPGLASGRLRVVNPFGTGRADDKRTYAAVEDLVRLHLGEEPLLRSVRTWDLGDPRQRAEALDRLDGLVLKPRSGSGGWGIAVLADVDAATRDRAVRTALEDPGGWLAQESVALSTCPVVVGDGLASRPVDLRPCVVSDGTTATVLPGGLTRFAATPRGVVNITQGGGAKDTWVLDGP